MLFKVTTDGQITRLSMAATVSGRPLYVVHAYLVDGLLIDTGCANVARAFWEFVRENPVEQAYITHYHEDHAGNNLVLNKLGIPSYAGEMTVSKLGQEIPYRLYEKLFWGVMPRSTAVPREGHIETSRHRFEIIPAPGHSKDMAVLFEKNEGWLFSADLYVAPRKMLWRLEENLPELMRSIEKTLSYDFEALYCSHRPVLKNGKQALARKLEIMKETAGSILELHKKGLPEREITRRVLGREMWLTLFTTGDMSKINAVRSVISSHAGNDAR
ncbi:MAG: MBL fold metallo-hydrolase [Firmicutes bacterium]|nr:MBL fold metallo-hydrolase [Bacillota bacterium]